MAEYCGIQSLLLDIRGILNIDQDDLYVGGATVVNGNLTSDATIVGGTLVISGGVNLGTGYQTGTSFNCKMTAYFEQSVIISRYLACTMTSVNNSCTDYVGVVINTNQGEIIIQFRMDSLAFAEQKGGL